MQAFDRLVRIGRVLVLNVKAISAPNSTAVLTDVDGLIRLSVDTTTCLTPRPGDYYFLYEPLSLTPWENHPFTLASAEALPSGGVRLHFLIMPIAGWTGRLRKSIESGKTEMRILLEGPYGQQANVADCDHVLLIAGGSGIAAILPYLATLPGRKVTLAWMARNAEYTVDVFTHELSASAISDVPIELFVTRQDADQAFSVLQSRCTSTFGDITAPTPTGVTIDVNADSERRTAPGVHIAPGRPDVDHMVRCALDRLVGDENLGIVACGPGVMLDDLRRAIASSYGSGKGQVSGSTLHYFEEAFVW
jgi:NAD(P)H-flavin reductase